MYEYPIRLSVMSTASVKDKNLILYVQSHFNSSNTDGSFTMVNSNWFLNPTKFFQWLRKTII